MRDRKGFSLIEVLVSLMVISVAFLAMWTLFVLSMRTNASAGDQTECGTLAQRRMEALKQVPYASLVNGGSIDAPTPGYTEYVDANGDSRNDYLVSWAVAYTTAPSTEKNLSAKHIGMVSLKVKCATLQMTTTSSKKPATVLFTTYRARGVE